jgi:hypothetical protein
MKSIDLGRAEKINKAILEDKIIHAILQEKYEVVALMIPKFLYNSETGMIDRIKTEDETKLLDKFDSLVEDRMNEIKNYYPK